MTIELDSCIKNYEKNKVCFFIENKTDFDIWIKNYLLTFYFWVYDMNGTQVQRKSSRHLNCEEIGQGEYTKIPKNKKVKIGWLADFFENYNFKKEEDYFIKSSYELTYLNREEKKKTRKTDFYLPKIKFSGRSNYFTICEQ